MARNRIVRTLAGIALAALAFASLPIGSASAAVNISGSWYIGMTHPDFQGSIYCAGPITQTGSSLSAMWTCDFFGSGTLSGPINTSSGMLSMSGTMQSSDQLNFSGTATMDGNSMSGSWTVTGIPQTGSFSGNRSPAVGGIATLPGVARDAGTGHVRTTTLLVAGGLLAVATLALGARALRGAR